MKPMNPNKKPLPKSQKLAKNILSKLLKLKDIHDQRKTPNQQLKSSVLTILNGYIEEFENESYRNSITLDHFIIVTPLLDIYEWETFDLLKMGEHLINGALIKVNNLENQKEQYYPINPRALRSVIQRAVNELEKINYYTKDEFSIIEKLAKLYQKFYDNISPILPIIKTWKTSTVEVSEIQLK